MPPPSPRRPWPPAALACSMLLAVCLAACSDDTTTPAASAGASGQAGAAGSGQGGAGEGGAGGTAGSGASGVGGAACAAGAGGDPFAGFEPLGCGDRIEGLAAALGLDGLELRREENGVWATVALDGTLCSAATDQAACQTKVEAARQDPAESTLKARPFPYYDRPTDRFIATRKDEVLVASDRPSLKALMAPIDSAAKLAVWLPYEAQISDPCTLRWKPAADGLDAWALRVVMDTCPVIVQDRRYLVRPDGETTSTESGAWKGSNSCGKPPLVFSASGPRPPT